MTETSPLESLYTEELYRLPGKMLIVIPKLWQEVTDDEKVLLGKILGAVKLSLASVQIVTRQEFSIDDMIEFSPRCILSFGANLNAPLNKYELINTGTARVIIADELRQLNDLTKRNLWLALKQVFQS
jgi:hypothetical protein